MPPLTIFAHAFESLERTTMKYSLDISGVAGFFAGDVAVSAMGTVNIYRGRKWLGWYNSPGSYEIAQSYGVLCRSWLWDALYPGVNVDPAHLFRLDGREGPPYRGVFSGARMAATGHIAWLLMDQCEDLTVPPERSHEAEGTPGCTVTVSTLSHRHEQTTDPTLSDGTKQTRNHSLVLRNSLKTYLSILPILVTLVTAVMCVLFANDYLSFGLILWGAFAGGVSCLVIGSGKLGLQHPDPVSGVPPGDGILGAEGNDVVLLLGPEEAVKVITRGKFSLTFGGKPRYHRIGFCAVLLTIQFIAQLLVIPLGTLFGQIMFLTSLLVSWAYSSVLSSIDRYSLQRDIVEQDVLRIESRKYRFKTRTTMSVYVLLCLKHQSQAETSVLGRALDELLPNDTDDWTRWKPALLHHLTSQDGFQHLDPTSVIDQPSNLIQRLCRSANDAIDFAAKEASTVT